MKKEHIANLFKQLGFFRPELTTSGVFTGKFLVNQIGVEKAKAAQAHLPALSTQMIPPDRDTLLDMIGKAGMEMKQFIEEIEMINEGHEMTMRHLRELDAHMNAILGDDARDLNPLEKMERIQGRYQQMAEFVKQVAETPAGYKMPKEISNASRFLNDKINPLVNQNDNAQKEEAAGGPVQQTEEQNGDGPLGAAAISAGLHLFTGPAETTTGNDAVGSAEVPAKESGGVEAQDSDRG